MNETENKFDPGLPTHPKGVKEILAEINDELRQLGRCRFGITFLDEALLGLFPKEVTLIGGRTGSGKTELATQILMAQHTGDVGAVKSVCYFALDHEEGEIENRILWRLITKQIRDSDLRHAFAGKGLRYIDWISGKYREELKDFEKDGRAYLSALLATAYTQFYYRKGVYFTEHVTEAMRQNEGKVSLFILDHFHALQGIDTLEEQKKAMMDLAEAAEDVGAPLVIIGQFRKMIANPKCPIPAMEEFSGSAQLIFVPNNIITISPRHIEGSMRTETYFSIQKARKASDAKAFVASHSFDTERKCYSDSYELFRYMPYSEPEPLSSAHVPLWAKHAVSTPLNPKTAFQIKKNWTERIDD